MLKNNEFIIVFVTAGSEREAEMLRKKLIENKLAACVTKTNINSMFLWKDKVENQDEVLLLIKTKHSLFEKIEALITDLHSYEVPEIIALPIIAGNKAYLDWIDESTA